MKLKPIGDRVLVRREESEEKTSGGIVLPDKAKEKPQKGTVLEVGDGRMTKTGKILPLQVKKGDKVYFTSWAGDEYKADGKELLLMREEDILAIID
jgi:chaperonin GroES